MVCENFSSFSTEIWSWKCWNAKMKICRRHTLLLYTKVSLWFFFNPKCIRLTFVILVFNKYLCHKQAKFEYYQMIELHKFWTFWHTDINFWGRIAGKFLLLNYTNQYLGPTCISVPSFSVPKIKVFRHLYECSLRT